MNLLEKQQIFAESFAKLIQFAISKGFKVVIGEVERSKAQAIANAKAGVGIKNSLHLIRLAGDLHLFKDGKYLDKSEDHRDLGKFWEGLSTPEAKHRWGGRFIGRPDGNHYSVEYEGRA
jgi:hypothetical protein